MPTELEIEDRLRRLPAGLTLSAEDRAALAMLRADPEPPASVQASIRRRRRYGLRVLAIAAALTAALGAGAVAVASPDSVQLLFHTIGWGAHPEPVAGGGPKQCPPARPVPAADLQRQVSFPVITASAPGATLVSSTYTPPCGSASSGRVELVYRYRGGLFILDERRAPAGPVQVDLKDYAKSSWRVVTVDGRDYAVQVLAGSVSFAVFKQGDTRVDVQIGAKGVDSDPVSLPDFEDLVRSVGSHG